MKYLEEDGIFIEQQFKGGRSCITNLISYYSRITKEIQKREGWVDSVFVSHITCSS